jgi:hypothetical protein
MPTPGEMTNVRVEFLGQQVVVASGSVNISRLRNNTLQTIPVTDSNVYFSSTSLSVRVGYTVMDDNYTISYSSNWVQTYLGRAVSIPTMQFSVGGPGPRLWWKSSCD